MKNYIILFLLSIMLTNAQSPALFKQKSLDLMNQMTIDEKISLLGYNNPGIERLNIKPVFMQAEMLHGIVCYDTRSTVFPVPIAFASTFNDSLIKKVAGIIADEARVANQKYNYSLAGKAPVLDIVRDPRWGRCQETFGEDPYLISRMGVAMVKGLQGDDSLFIKILPFPKHFAVYSGPEPTRYGTNVQIGERDLRESYLPAFKSVIKEANVRGLMTSYCALRGVPSTCNDYLLKTILRNEWGFDGVLSTDGWAIGFIFRGQNYVDNMPDAVRLSLESGVDLDLGNLYQTELKGLISTKPSLKNNIDSSLLRILNHRFMLGEFEPEDKKPFVFPDSIIDSYSHRLVSREVARESMVLLHNKNNVLPFNKDLKKILIVGPFAHAEWNQGGSYSSFSKNAISMLEGLQAKLPTAKIDWFDIFAFPYYFTEVFSGKYLTTEDGQRGIKGEYYDNPQCMGEPVFTRIDSVINFNWENGSPSKDIKDDLFSVKWTAYFKAPTSERMAFKFTSDDGVRFFINDSLMVNDWGTHEYYSNVCYYTVDSGKSYKLELRYFDSLAYARVMAEYAANYTINSNMKFIVDSAKFYDAIIFVGGLSPILETEHNDVNLEDYKYGDRLAITLPRQQRETLDILKNSGKPVILAIMGGSSFDLSWEQNNIDGIIDTWYSGEEGGTAFADILFGDVNPSGKLPLTFYKSINDLPDFHNFSFENRSYRYFNGEVLYPFGYGLSYTKFNIDGLNLPKYNFEVCNEDNTQIRFKIKNIGNREGAEVVQVYIKKLNSKVSQPIKALKGYKKINLIPGEEKLDSIKLNLKELYYFDEKRNDYIVEPGKYEIQLGNSSRDIMQRDTIFIENCIVSILESELPDNIIYPNPVNDVINFRDKDKFYKSIKIYDLMGTVQFELYDYQANSINIGNLPSGNYLMELMDTDKSYYTKFQITK